MSDVKSSRAYEELRHKVSLPETPGFNAGPNFDNLAVGGLRKLRAMLGNVPSLSVDRHVEWNDLIEDSVPFTVTRSSVEILCDVLAQRQQLQLS